MANNLILNSTDANIIFPEQTTLPVHTSQYFWSYEVLHRLNILTVGRLYVHSILFRVTVAWAFELCIAGGMVWQGRYRHRTSRWISQRFLREFLQVKYTIITASTSIASSQCNFYFCDRHISEIPLDALRIEFHPLSCDNIYASLKHIFWTLILFN